MKIIFTIFISLLLLLTKTNSVFASDADITCSSGGCSPTVITAFFPSSETWYPGKINIRTLNVTNSTRGKHTVDVSSKNQNSQGNLDRVLNLTISRTINGYVLYENSLKNFFSDPPVRLSTLSSGEAEEYAFKILMDSSAGNEFQGKAASFDLVFNFSEVSESPTPTNIPDPTSTPLPGPTETPGPGPTSTPGPSANTTNPTSTPIPVFYPFFAPITTIIPTVAEEVLGGETTPSPALPGGVLGTTQTNGTKSCRNSFWWFLLLALQMTLNLSIIRRIPKKLASLTNIIILAVNTISVFLFWQFFCTKNYLLLSFVFGILSFYLHLRRVKRKRFQKIYSSYVYPEIRLPHAAI